MEKTAKLHYCDKCEHHKWDDPSEDEPCAIGHSPRFVMPTIAAKAHEWGWMRRCDDFVQAANG